MINIQNESSLHNTLKSYYCAHYSGETEVKADGHIYDIVGKDGCIIEIQTKSLSSLYNKIQDILNKNKTLILVHPVVITKTIISYDEEGKIISKRKSSDKGHVLKCFDELTKIYPFLLHKNITLELLEVKIIEERIKTKEKIQSKNKRRRYKLNWNKSNKRLEEIISTKVLKTKEDYFSLLPQNLPEEFSSKELKAELKLLKVPARIYNNCNLIIWVLSKMELLIPTKVEKRFRYYKKNG